MHSNGTMPLPLDTRCVYTLTARPGGLSVQGEVYPGEGGSLSRGGLCQGNPPRTVKSGRRYASYWNAFLFSKTLMLMPSVKGP